MAQRASSLLQVAYATVSRIAARRGTASPSVVSKWSDTAVEAAQTALGLYMAMNDQHGQAGAFYQLGSAQLVKGVFDQALASAMQCQRLFKESLDRNGEGSAYCLIAEIHHATKNTEEAMKAGANAQNIFKAGEDDQGTRAALEVMGRIGSSKEWQVLTQKQVTAKTESTKQTMLTRGHGWGFGKPVGFGTQYVRFLGMRGRPAANMKT